MIYTVPIACILLMMAQSADSHLIKNGLYQRTHTSLQSAQQSYGFRALHSNSWRLSAVTEKASKTFAPPAGSPVELKEAPV